MRVTRIRSTLLQTICFCVVSGILVAGLWPFRAPINEVSWLSGGHGLFLGKQGSIISLDLLKRGSSQVEEGCSLAVGFEPSRNDSEGVILSFYRPETQVTSLSLRQVGQGLVIEHQSQRSGTRLERQVAGVFSGARPILLIVISGKGGTSAYVDGTLIAKLTDLIILTPDITGRLLIGNTPSMSYTWSGTVRALSLYSRELPVHEVSTQFAQWTKSRELVSASKEGIVASYAFDEGRGTIIHNQVASATNLIIPHRFFVLNKAFLERPWTEFRPPWSSYCSDVAINIVAFIPLGLFLCAYFSRIRKIEHPAAVTIALGFVLSLMIEVLQAFLPSRASGMTDLVTNTFGTAVGAAVFRGEVVHALLSRVAVCSENTSYWSGLI